jgi:Chitobiase/beta-hexosaminidase C-terminal domain
MNGSWTENSVNNTSAQRQANWNVSGDGKFDQNELPTTGASIRYTLDGSEPTAASVEYAQPFSVSSSTTVKAKAFMGGLAESPTASASFTFDRISSGQAHALFVRTDGITQGNWKGDLVWDFKGHVQVRFIKITGNNALVMGMFFGPAATQLGNLGWLPLRPELRPGLFAD